MRHIQNVIYSRTVAYVTNKFVDELLHILHKVLPLDNAVANSYYKAKIIADLGLDYEKIHAYINDCILFKRSRVLLVHVYGVQSRWSASK